MRHFPEVDYFGFDINAKYIELAKKNFSSRGNFTCQDILQASSSNFTDTFDVVMANGVLHHIDDKNAGILFNFAKALEREDTFITLNPDEPVTWKEEQEYVKSMVKKGKK